VIIPSARRGLPVALAAIAAVAGTIVAIHYHRLGLTLSHYDARGHLVVARRIIDSLTPGWQQIGAVWLPLPHLLNALPVQVDAWYGSGASAVAISIAAFAVAVSAISWIVLELTGSRAAAFAAATVFALNPNVLYLQATPMTEPLLLALTTLSVAMLMDWCRAITGRMSGTGGNAGTGTTGILPSSLSFHSSPSRHSSPSCPVIGSVFALACLTRYEAWPVTFAALTAAIWARWRQGDPLALAARRVGAIALFPVAAIAGFLVFSRVVIGQWFVASGFFTPENKALGDPMIATAEIWYGLHSLSGSLIVTIAAVGAAALLILGIAKARWSPALVVLSLVATAFLPWLAFVEGHPFRIRYMVPLIAIEAIGAGVAVGLARRLSASPAFRHAPRIPSLASDALIVVLSVLLAYELRPLDLTAPMVVEAQWDRPNVPVREQVTACLGSPRPGEKIMASMGSLGHYMQETSRAGFHLRDFLHEGNGDIWLAALATGPRPFADWVLIEEKAEGGDTLATLAHERPDFLDGYSRVCDGAGLALYKRAEGRGQRAEGKG
jgi:hypothetical protein